MSSFLCRNIATNLFFSNNTLNNNSSLSPISKFMRAAKNKTFSKRKTKTLDNSIYYIFKIIYEREFPNILIIKSKLFLQNVNKKSEDLIYKNLSNVNDYSEIKTFIGKGKDKVLHIYNEEFSFLNEYYLNYKKNPKNFNFLQDNIIKHCNNIISKTVFLIIIDFNYLIPIFGNLF